MARYINEIPVCVDATSSFAAVRAYLESQKFEYIQYQGENVFKKGNGWLVAPTFIKLTYFTNRVRLEAWIKMAPLPGVFTGEYGMEGAVGAAAKGAMKRCIPAIEQMLASHAIRQPAPETSESTAEESAAPMAENVPQAAEQTVPAVSAVAQAEDPYQTKPIPAGVTVTKGEFRRNYSSDKFKKDIRIVAIIGYVLVGINALSALAFPGVWLDVAVLLGLTLGMHLRKSKGCAIAILAYTGVGCILSLISGNGLSGWLWIFLSIMAIVYIEKVDKQYKAAVSGEKVG